MKIGIVNATLYLGVQINIAPYLHLSSEILELGKQDVHAVLLLLCYKFWE